MITLAKLLEWVSENDAIYLLDLAQKLQNDSFTDKPLFLYIYGTGNNGKTTFKRWFETELNLPSHGRSDCYWYPDTFDRNKVELLLQSVSNNQTTHLVDIVESNRPLGFVHPQVKTINFPNLFFNKKNEY